MLFAICDEQSVSGHWIDRFLFNQRIANPLRIYEFVNSEQIRYSLMIIMKTKAQKQTELNEGKKLLEKSQVLIFTDFSGVGTAHTRNLRQQLKEVQAKYFVIKKRLLSLLFKEQWIEVDAKTLGTQLGTIFSES